MRQRSNSRASPNCFAHAANASVGPRHRSSSTSRKSGASVRSVASFLKSNARSRRSPRTAGGKSSMMPCRFRSPAAVTGPIPRIPGYPSAASPTRARKSGIRAGSTPNSRRTPFASRIFRLLRSACTIRSPRTHCARSLSGVQIQIFWTAASSDARLAAEARASSASSSVMGHTATPMDASASSSGWNCARSARSTPSPVL